MAVLNSLEELGRDSLPKRVATMLSYSQKGKCVDYDGLERLGRLRDSGTLSDEEFDREKQQLLARKGSPLKEGTLSGTGRRKRAAALAALGLLAAVLVSLLSWSAFREGERDAVTPPTGQTVAPAGNIIEGRDLEGDNAAIVEAPSPPAASKRTAIPTAPQPTQTRSVTDPFTRAEQRLIDENQRLESLCRGGTGEESDRACDERSSAMDRLNAIGICWGRESEAYAEYTFHRCGRGSIR